MGQKISFRGGRQCAVESGGAVSITEPRVKFRKGWLTGGTDPEDGSVECGDGTAYPMEVNKQQFEGIFYRVKDAWFTSGFVTYNYGVAYTTDTLGTLSFNFIAPPTEFCDATSGGLGAGNGYTVRSYCTFAEGLSPAVPMSEYDSNFLGETYYFTGVYNPMGSGAGNVAVRDANSELGIWCNLNIETQDETTFGQYDISGSDSLSFLDITYTSDIVGGGQFRTGFTHHSSWDYVGSSLNTDHYKPISTFVNYLEEGDTEYGYAEVQLAFSGSVAWIDDDGSGNPFSSGNRMFAEVEFSGIIDASPFAEFISTNINAGGVSMTAIGNNLIINFGGSGIPDASCPLYNAFTTVSASADFVITAGKWWEYADRAGLPAWDSTTGQPANGGVAG